MTNSNIKGLSLKEIQKSNKKLDAQKTVYVQMEGKEFKIEVDEFFRKSKQASLLDDIVKFMTTVEDKGSLDLSMAYTKLLMIKHFTSLDVPDDIPVAIKMLRMLIDLDLLDQVVNEMPEEEVTKMTELITENIHGLADQYEEISKQVKSKELKEMLRVE
jgi:hypothetical protein